jgi:hypothetical protein
MPNQDERRAKIIVEEIASSLGVEVTFGSQENFDKLFQEFLKTDYLKDGEPMKPYTIALAFGLWYREKIGGINEA